MPRQSGSRQALDMYWFAHGGLESSSSNEQHSLPRESTPGPTDTEEECSEGSPPSNKPNTASEESTAGKSNFADRPDSNGRANCSSKRLAVEERKRLLLEAEQEKNEAILKKHAEREAALEARRNAQRSNISFAFGTSLPLSSEFDIAPVQLQPSVHSHQSKAANNLMTQSLSMSYTRGRRKNDLTPTVPYDRTGGSVRSATGQTRKRSVSMSRLDVLAQPRRHYVEAQKAGSTMSSSSACKDTCNSPKRPLSSASDKSNRSGRVTSSVTVNRRPHTTARKPRPISIAGTTPDFKSHPVRSSTPLRKPPSQNKKQDPPNRAASSGEINLKNSNSKRSTGSSSQKLASEKQKNLATTKAPSKPTTKSTSKQSTPKTSPSRKLLTNKKQAAMLVSTPKENLKEPNDAPKSADVLASAVTDEDAPTSDEKNLAKQHIISEEEAKAALAEKRRLAREQAEKEAAVLRQQQEELERERERQLRLEEERQRQMEEEQLRLLEEHKRFEEEKLQKAIEEHERKDEEEKARREEEVRLKAEQEKKAKEEAEKQRIELEEKLRKEEEERAERKKRLEKIMSRTRGKSGTASPSGSLNGSEPLDSCENQPLSSEPSSLDSNEQFPSAEQSSPSESFDVNQTLYLASQSLSSNDLMLPSSERTSLDGSLQAFPSEPTSLEPHNEVPVPSECVEQGNLLDEMSSGTETAKEVNLSSQSTLTHSTDQKLTASENTKDSFENESNECHEYQPTSTDAFKEQAANLVTSESNESVLADSSVPEKTLVEEKISEEQAKIPAPLSNQSDAFFQQVESEFDVEHKPQMQLVQEPEVTHKNLVESQFEVPETDDTEGEVSYTGSSIVESSVTAVLQESESPAFFRQVESGSLNPGKEDYCSEIPTDLVSSTISHCADLSAHSKCESNNEALETSTCIFPGTPGPFQEQETEATLKVESKTDLVVSSISGFGDPMNVMHNMAGNVIAEPDSTETTEVSDLQSQVTIFEFSSTECGKDKVKTLAKCDEVEEQQFDTCVTYVEQFANLQNESCERGMNHQFPIYDDNLQQEMETSIIKQAKADDSDSANVGEFIVPHIPTNELMQDLNSNVPASSSANDKEELPVLNNPGSVQDSKDFTPVLDEQNKTDMFVTLNSFTDSKVLDNVGISEFVAEVSPYANENNPFNNDGVLASPCDVFHGVEVPAGTIIQSTETLIGQVNNFSNPEDSFIKDRHQLIDTPAGDNPFIQENLSVSTITPEISEGVITSNAVGYETNPPPLVLPPSESSNDHISTFENFDIQSTNFVVEDSLQTYNPFGVPAYDGKIEGGLLLPSDNGLSSAIDYIVEESEDSSLDSNLSQVLNVHINEADSSEGIDVSTKSLPNGQSYASSDPSKPVVAFCDIMGEAPKANGCNGSTYDGRLESADFHADQLSDSSIKLQHLPDNGDVQSRNTFCLDDHMNSVKAASNPFLGVSEGNPFSSNPF